MAFMNIPKTKKTDFSEVLHGKTIVDPYRWLEATDSAETQTWLDEQEIYTKSLLDSYPNRQELRSEFEGLFREETIGVPRAVNGCYFFTKRLADQDMEVLYYKKSLDGEAIVLMDPNKISKERGVPVSFMSYHVSHDASLVVYFLSDAGNDKSNLYVMNVETKEVLSDFIPGHLIPLVHFVSWSHDNSGFWYTRRPENVPVGDEKFYRNIFYHKLGDTFDQDVIVFKKDLPKEDIPTAMIDSTGRYLLVTVYVSSRGSDSTDLYYLDLFKPENGFVTIVAGVEAHVFADIHRDFIYIKNNIDAPMWKIQRVSIDKVTEGVNVWEDVIVEDENKLIEDFSVIGDRLFVTTLENVHSVLREYSLVGDFKREIDLPTIGSASTPIGEAEGNEAFFVFNSFVYPPAVFRIDLKTDEVKLYEQQKISADTSNIESKQVWYKSKDGTDVPMFLVHNKNLQLNGENPTVVYGYGGFSSNLLPAFRKSIIPFVQRGGIHVFTNLRGGAEFGTDWHTAAIKFKKQNTFDDMIAAVEYLINNKYTNSEKIAISGASNGGLLVGAVMTQRPELIKAVIMSVPVADMLRFHLFHGGRHWISNYGDPDDPAMFEYLLTYSPYHNVRPNTAYPATMVITSDQDDRVHPGQAFKMTAALQEMNVSENPIILRIERGAGHGGALDISRFIDRAVDEWGFLFKHLGV